MALMTLNLINKMEKIETSKKKPRQIADGLSWVEDRSETNSKLKFGPPLFDETTNAFNWRRFKRGFVAGKKKYFKKMDVGSTLSVFIIT